MPKRRGKKSGGNNKKSRDAPTSGGKKWGTDRDDIAMSESFKEYYSEIIPADEWDAFVGSLMEGLPITFRFNGELSADSPACVLRDDFIKAFGNDGETTEVEVPNNRGEGTIKFTVTKPQQLPWYPHGLGFKLKVPKLVLRKHADFQALHEYLKVMHVQGAITRQEAVSMLPPLFLDVQPGHRVIDMCAAPGSKSAQLVDMVMGKPHLPGAGPADTGIVVANDAERERAYLLCFNLGRVGSPLACVTCHDAGQYPHPPDVPLYDRVLADVPCSGDGTLRKAPDLWRRWNAAQGVGLHAIQLRIAIRAFNLLKPGCRMVYSTCSFNPVENEAVVAALLQTVKGASLVDMSGAFPGLPRRQGLQAWRVFNYREKAWYSKADDVPAEAQDKYVPSMFPPAQDKLEGLGLQHCMRFYPHDGDTGGFFITVIEKAADAAPAETDEEAEQPKKRRATPVADPAGESKHLIVDVNGKTFSEDAFLPLAQDSPVLQTVKDFFGLTAEFPTANMVVRGAAAVNKPSKLYVVPPAAMDFTTRKTRDGRRYMFNMINCGIDVFGHCNRRQETNPWRVTQQAATLVGPFCTKRVLDLQRKDLAGLFKYGIVGLIDRPDEPNSMGMWLPEATIAAIQALDTGCFLARVPGRAGPEYYSLWRAKASVATLIKKDLLAVLCEEFGEEVVLPSGKTVTTMGAPRVTE